MSSSAETETSKIPAAAPDAATATTNTPAASATGSRYAWRVVDIIIASVIGVASGIVFWAWGLAYNGLSAPLQLLPGLSAILGGGWLFAGVLGGLVIRKPGAAIYTEVLAAVVSALIGTQWGFLTLESGLVQGLGAELVFLAFAYRKFGLGVATLAGAAAGVTLAINDLILWYPGVDVGFQAVYFVSAIVSGAVIAGIGSYYLVRALARTGALSRFAAGQETAEAV
ncbi:Putative HMP/thiamine permease protein YkoE [Propionicimonas sp. T2.31MG-18]|uniref:ECF transporter S component n=1 Tax=Propionicimonas sp. T2.31MG-18 TaxID=3157620 RepID=UPI0035E8F820